MAWRRVIVCKETIENLPPPCGETLQSGYSKERGGWGKYEVINFTVIPLSTVARNSGSIALILLWVP